MQKLKIYSKKNPFKLLDYLAVILFGERYNRIQASFFAKTESLSIKKSIQVTGLPCGDPFWEPLQSNSSQFFAKTESLSIKKSIQVTGLPCGDPFWEPLQSNSSQFFAKN